MTLVDDFLQTGYEKKSALRKNTVEFSSLRKLLSVADRMYLGATCRLTAGDGTAGVLIVMETLRFNKFDC